MKVIEEVINIYDEHIENDEDFKVMLIYIMSIREDVKEKDIIEAANKISRERGEFVMTIAEKLRNEGMEKGRKEGRKEGLEEGLEKGKIETAKNLRKIGMDIKVISEATNLPIEKLEKVFREEESK